MKHPSHLSRVAAVRNVALLVIAMVAGGFAWMVLLTTMNVATRMVVARWVPARALSVYLLVLQGASQWQRMQERIRALPKGARIPHVTHYLRKSEAES